MKQINLSELSNVLQAFKNCDPSNEWKAKHEARIETLCERLPHGSGLDNGVTFDREASSQDRLVFHTSFHHMDEHGYYDGWTDHTIIATPSFISGFQIDIKGKNRNDIKDYLHQLFSECFYLDTTYMMIRKAKLDDIEESFEMGHLSPERHQQLIDDVLND